MGLSTHAENKYGHKQNINTHKNTQIFCQLRPRQNPFNLLWGKPVRELFKFIYLSSSGKIHSQKKENNKIQLISLAQNSLKIVPTLPRFPCPLETEYLYGTDTDCTIHILYGLYRFTYHCTNCTDFSKNIFLKNFSRMV